jgi:heme O synthase-like polyprenyltransferase
VRLERYAVRLGAYAAEVIATSIRAEEARSHARRRDDVALAKSRLYLLVVATTGAGAFLASPAGPGWTTASVAMTIFVSCIGLYTVKRWVVRGRG